MYCEEATLTSLGPIWVKIELPLSRIYSGLIIAIPSPHTPHHNVAQIYNMLLYRFHPQRASLSMLLSD